MDRAGRQNSAAKSHPGKKPFARIVPVEATLAPLEERLRRLETAGVIVSRPPAMHALPQPLPLEAGLAQRISMPTATRDAAGSERDRLGYVRCP